MQLPKVSSMKVYKILSDPRFLKEFSIPYKVDREYDIPYVAGYSSDSKTVYIDRHFKKMMGSINIEPYIFIHEKCEKAIIDTFGLKYQEAHHIATHLERMTLSNDGIDWNKYEPFITKQYKKIGHEKLEKTPADLDLTPYRDEKDFGILKQIIMSSKNDSTYSNKKSNR